MLTCRTKTTRIALLLALGLLAGCRKGPDPRTLERQVQDRLDRSFGKGLLRVAELSRKGHYAYREEGGKGRGGDRLLVYFNAELELLKDYRFSNWDQLNVGSLISVLGATPNGVRGVKPGGNRKGERIAVHGASAYAKSGEGWRPVAYLPAAREKKGAQTTDKDLLPYRRHLNRLGEIGAAFQKSKDKGDLDALAAGLEDAVARAERRLGRRQGWLTLSTGNPSGEYFRQGQTLAQVLTGAGHKARAFPSSGSLENCRLVEQGEVLFGYSQNDIAQMGFSGTDLFDRQAPLKNLRALCSLYPEAVQIVTLRGGPRSVAALRGKRVNIGGPGSGVRQNALQVLAEAGLQLRDLAAVHDAPLSQAMTDLRERRIDALFFTSAYPNRALYKMAEKTPIDLVPLAPGTVDKLRVRHPYLAPLELPANTYPSVKDKRLTVQVTAMLVAHRDAPADKVRTLLETLFANVPALSRGSLQAYFISKQTALSGVSIPLHPAAKRFFKKTD